MVAYIPTSGCSLNQYGPFIAGEGISCIVFCGGIRCVGFFGGIYRAGLQPASCYSVNELYIITLHFNGCHLYSVPKQQNGKQEEPG